MHYVKTGNGKWVLDEIEGESASLTLATVDFTITLGDIYEQVDFTVKDGQEESD